MPLATQNHLSAYWKAFWRYVARMVKRLILSDCPESRWFTASETLALIDQVRELREQNAYLLSLLNQERPRISAPPAAEMFLQPPPSLKKTLH
jgi:hypothetical protein